jgi:aspartate/tyrosine/aromatic aminotransferase
MFETLETPPPDKILALSAAFRADPRPGKLDLGVGVYRDAEGRTGVMRAVKAAETRLLAAQDTKTYLGPAGDEGFGAAMTGLVFGAAAPLDRLRAAQAPGGTGALRLLADLIARARPGATVWLSDPTWPNHAGVMRGAGLKPRTYPYFDAASGAVDFEAMRAALSGAAAGDVVVLHGCCHNPTGANLTADQWREIAALALSRGFVPFVDLAYQGFGDGLEADAEGTRILAAAVPEMLVAASCSKNFAIYRERVGCAMVLSATPAVAAVTLEQMKAAARVLWSMPPDHGAAVVRMVLEDKALRADWEAELEAMRLRMLDLRAALAEALRARTNSGAFDFVARHRGMFSLLGLTPAQVERLRAEHGVYAVGDSRINVAGLTPAGIAKLVEAVAAVAA